MEKTLLEYGALGAILVYFLWKDSKTFELHRTTMREIVDEIKNMREEQNSIKGDVEDIKERMGRS